jgi:hypothetical protein
MMTSYCAICCCKSCRSFTKPWPQRRSNNDIFWGSSYKVPLITHFVWVGVGWRSCRDRHLSVCPHVFIYETTRRILIKCSPWKLVMIQIGIYKANCRSLETAVTNRYYLFYLFEEKLCIPKRSWNTSVAITTSYDLDTRRSIPGRGERLFSMPHHPVRLWGPPSFLSNWYRRFLPREGGESGLGMKLTTHLQLMPRSRIVELYLHSPTRLNGVVLN